MLKRGETVVWLTVNTLSQRLQIKSSTLYAWANQGKIPCRKIHGLVRFDPTEIDRWLASFASPTVRPYPDRDTQSRPH